MYVRRDDLNVTPDKNVLGRPHQCMLVCGLYSGRPAELPEDRAALPLHGVARSWGAGDDPVARPVCENCKGLHRQGVRLGAYSGPLQVQPLFHMHLISTQHTWDSF